MRSLAGSLEVFELSVDDIEAAPAGFSGLDLELSLAERATREWRFLELRLGSLSLLEGQMGAALTCVGEVDDANHWFFVPTSPPTRYTVNGLQIEPDELKFMPARGEFLIGTAAPVDFITLRLSPEEIEQRRARLGIPDELSLHDFRAFRSQPVDVRRLVQTGKEALRIMRTRPEHLATAAARERLQRLLMGRLVECLRAPGEEPPVRCSLLTSRCRAYLEARRSEPVFAEDMCAALGVSDRTLRRLFVDAFGTSPGRHLRRRRLHQARCELLDPGATTRSVTDVAIAYGFLDAGRFAADYRALFDEYPSTTLRNARGVERAGASPAQLPRPR